MQVASQAELCLKCRRRMIDDGQELVCPKCGETQPKTVLPLVRSPRPAKAVELTRSGLGGFMGRLELSYGETYSPGFSKINTTYGYLKMISDFGGRGGREYNCAKMIERICEKLSVPTAVVQNGVMVMRKVLSHEDYHQLAPEPTVPVLCAFSIIAAIKLTGNKTVSWQSVIGAFQDCGHRVTRSEIIRTALASPIQIRPTPAEEYLQILLQQVRDNPEFRTKSLGPEYFSRLSGTAAQLIKKVKAVQGGHNPRAVTATAIYAAEVVLSKAAGRKRKLTQRDAAELVHVAEYTIREQYEELFRDTISSIPGG